jgi:hypothetical protein
MTTEFITVLFLLAVAAVSGILGKEVQKSSIGLGVLLFIFALTMYTAGA